MAKKKLWILGIMLFVVMVITGASFALWQITLKQESENIISTSCFKISLKEENSISLNEAYPITEEEGLSLTPFTFTIENICDANASYQVNLEVLNESTLENQDYLKLSFESVGEEKKPVFLIQKEEVSPTLKNEKQELITKKAYKLEEGYLGIGDTRSYQVSLWMDEDAPAIEEIMQKTFFSKISVIATYKEDYDLESPITNIEVTNLTNKLEVSAEESRDNNKIKYYYYSLDGEEYIKTQEAKYTFDIGRLEYGKGTDIIQTLANSLNEKYTVYVKVEDEYGNISEGSKIILKDFASDNTTDNNLRYIGFNPNNYVLFNNELWRVIGVLNNVTDNYGQKEPKLKLIKATPYKESMQWGSNSIPWETTAKWANTTSQIELNTTYYNSFTETAKAMISTSVWNFGACDVDYNLTPLGSYQGERSNWANGRPTTWTGNIAFMYASDYGYATSGGSTEQRETCINLKMPVDWSKNPSCYQNNWMYNPMGGQWTISQHSSGCAVRVSKDVGDCNLYTDYRVATPVLYLKSTVNIVEGIGTEDNPYQLLLD